MNRFLLRAAALLVLGIPAALAQPGERMTVKHFPAPLPGIAWAPREAVFERGRMAPADADRLFGEVRRILAAHGIASDWQYVIPDGAFTRIAIETGGRSLQLASAHTEFERGGRAIALERGVQALDGRDAQALLAKESEAFRNRRLAFEKILALAEATPGATVAPKVVDIPTRPGVTQRMVVLAPPAPRAAAILFAGGHGGLQIRPDGTFGWGQGNFLVRTRELFASQGLLVAVVDAPSDRQSEPFLGGFRQVREHAADIEAVIAWIRTQAKVPVWLVGTSRGTQSAAYLATELTGPEGPDGIVLTSSILFDRRGRALPEMPLARIRVPVLVVHHEKDGCASCSFSDLPLLMDRLTGTPRKELAAFTGGVSQGDPCEARAYHGYNGIEREVVERIARWMLAK